MGAIIEDVLLQLEGKERILADSVAILLFIIFLFIAFRGYKLFKFVAGFEVAALVFVLLGLLDWVAIACILVAFIIGCLVYTFYEKMLTVIVFLITGLLTLVLCGLGFGMSEAITVIIAILVAILAAFLAYKFTKIFIIVYTSIQFGCLCGTMVNYVFNDPFDNFKLIAQIVFSALAIYMQYKKYGFGKEKSVSDFSWKESLAKLEDANANPQITVINREDASSTITDKTVTTQSSALLQKSAIIQAKLNKDRKIISKKTYIIILGILGVVVLIIAWIFTIRYFIERGEEKPTAYEDMYDDTYSDSYDKSDGKAYEKAYEKKSGKNNDSKTEFADDYMDQLLTYSKENHESIVNTEYVKSEVNLYAYATLMPEEPDFWLPYAEMNIYSSFEVAFYDGNEWSIIDRQNLPGEDDPYYDNWKEVSTFGKLTFDDEQHYYVEVYGVAESDTKYIYGFSDDFSEDVPTLLLSGYDIFQTENGTFCRTWGESGIVNVEVGFDGDNYIQYSSESVSEEKMRRLFNNFDEVNTSNLNELYNQKNIYIEGWDVCNIDSVSDAHLEGVWKGSNDKYYLSYEYRFSASYSADLSSEIDQVFYYTYSADDDILIREEGDEFINFDRKPDSTKLNLTIE